MIEASEDSLKQSELGILVASTLHKLESISDHHVEERRKNFRITNVVVFVVAALLLIIGIINMFYLYHFYQSTMRIIKTTHDLDMTVELIGKNMQQIDHTMGRFNTHIASMNGIYDDISTISYIMPEMHNSMSTLQLNMSNMNDVMGFVNKDIQLIDFHLQGMNYKVANMGGDIYQLAKPIGMFNRFIP